MCNVSPSLNQLDSNLNLNLSLNLYNGIVSVTPYAISNDKMETVDITTFVNDQKNIYQ